MSDVSSETDKEEKVEIVEEDTTTEEVQASEEDNVSDISDKSEEEVEKKEEDFKEKYFYLAAEMQNMKKRFEREKEGIVKYGAEKILSGLVEVVDNLDRALDAIKDDEDDKVKNIFAGVDMVRTQFLGELKKSGLEAVETDGKEFDPNFHEALAQQPAEGKDDQQIISEFQKGYILNGRLLRAAKVVIVKN